MKFNQILFWAVQDQFPINFNWNLNEIQLDSLLDCPRSISHQFQLRFESKSIRFSSGLPQINFLSISIQIQNKVNQVLSWAAPRQFPTNSICCPNSICYQFQLKSKSHSIRFSPGLPQMNFLRISRQLLAEITKNT